MNSIPELIFIVPFRNRGSQLNVFLNHMKSVFFPIKIGPGRRPRAPKLQERTGPGRDPANAKPRREAGRGKPRKFMMSIAPVDLVRDALFELHLRQLDLLARSPLSSPHLGGNVLGDLDSVGKMLPKRSYTSKMQEYV